jgi:hypothetical protein
MITFEEECTGFCASWCHHCGDCECPCIEHDLVNCFECDSRDQFNLSFEGCPLHSPQSKHAEHNQRYQEYAFQLEKNQKKI